MTDEQYDALVEWVRERPPVVRDMMVDWPPMAYVQARFGVFLMFPAPDIVGRVVSYFENGNLGVAAPAAATITSPITGNTIEAGEVVQGECTQDQIELVEFADITPDDVRRAIKDAS